MTKKLLITGTNWRLGNYMVTARHTNRFNRSWQAIFFG